MAGSRSSIHLCPRYPAGYVSGRLGAVLPLFTELPRGTVLKIQMGFTLGSREALKRDEKPPYWPLLRHQNTRSRPVQLFSKQFQKGSSRKPHFIHPHTYRYRGVRERACSASFLEEFFSETERILIRRSESSRRGAGERKRGVPESLCLRYSLYLDEPTTCSGENLGHPLNSAI